MVCKAFSRVVVETWVLCWAADRATPAAEERSEYWENLFAMLRFCQRWECWYRPCQATRLTGLQCPRRTWGLEGLACLGGGYAIVKEVCGLL